MSVEARLKDMGITLPQAAAPVANYVPAIRSGSWLIISGQLCFGPDGTLAPEHKGKLGGTVSAEAATRAAQLCAINILAQAKAAIGSLDQIERCLRLGGFINCVPDYAALPAIMNGASNFMVDALGPAGRHTRTTIGVAELPMDAVVEVEALFEVS